MKGTVTCKEEESSSTSGDGVNPKKPRFKTLIPSCVRVKASEVLFLMLFFLITICCEVESQILEVFEDIIGKVLSTIYR